MSFIEKGWLGLKAGGSFVESDSHFGHLLKAGVSYYDEQRNVPKLEKQREAAIAKKTHTICL
jgi:hypothetical protein